MRIICFLLLSLSFTTNLLAKKLCPDLHDAVNYGHLAIVKILVDGGTQVDCQGKSGHTPLYNAVLRGHRKISSYLLENGANPNFQGDRRLAPIHANFFISMGGDSVAMLDLMLRHNGNVGLEDQSGRIPMNYAISRGDLPAIRKLMSSGTQVTHTTKSEDTFLIQAVRQRNPELIDYFLNTSIDINATNKKGLSALSAAVTNKDFPTTLLLLKNGADANIGLIYGLSNLAYATTGSTARVMDILIKNSADLGFISEEGLSPLSLAISNCDMGRVNLLLALGADANIGRPYGHSNFYHAALKCNPDIIKILHRHGVNINEIVDKGELGRMTALDQAILQDNSEMIDYLRSIAAKTSAEFNQ